MISKEEILKNFLSVYFLTIEDISHGTSVIPVILKRAMDYYAEQMCIEFLKWNDERKVKGEIFVTCDDNELFATFKKETNIQ